MLEWNRDKLNSSNIIVLIYAFTSLLGQFNYTEVSRLFRSYLFNDIVVSHAHVKMGRTRMQNELIQILA